jgi:hypothetical protein
MPKVVVHAAIRVVPARLEEFKTIFGKLVEASQKEAGTETYTGASFSSLFCLSRVLIHAVYFPSCSSTSLIRPNCFSIPLVHLFHFLRNPSPDPSSTFYVCLLAHPADSYRKGGRSQHVPHL